MSKVEALLDFVRGLDKEDLFSLAWELLYWQAIEIGEDVSIRKAEDGKVEDIYWSSCGKSLIREV